MTSEARRSEHLAAAPPSHERARERLSAVAALGERLEAAAERAEAQRTLPADIVEVLREAGLFWLKTPLVLGGYELDPLDFCDVLEAVAYHDASAAWAVMVGNGVTGLLAGTLDDAGLEMVFEPGRPLPVLAGQFVPRGSAVPDSGGYRVSGHWSFCSGIMHASWVVGGCTVEGTGELMLACFPKSEVSVLDTWYAAGLQGTGSHDFTVSDHFVPEVCTIRLSGDVAKRGGPLYRQSPVLFVANELSPVAIGISRRAVGDTIALAGPTVRGFGAVRLAERPAFHGAVGRIDAELRAAELLYRDAVAAAWARVLEGQPEDEAVIARIRAWHTLCASRCADAIGELFRYGGGRALANANPMQRHYRNLIALAQHLYVSDETYEHSGAALLASQ
jgi:alkylation response protein AidB-like acyl-CoA dehydrogenase